MTDRYENIRRALAMGPTPGPWEYDENADGSCPLVYGANETPVLKFDQGCPYDYDPSWDVRGVDAAYIAACDPDTIRALLAERDALAAREDAWVALVADIRFACGDNGKRMQPELVEFIRGLAEDAARYRLLRKGAVDDVAVVRGLGAMDYGMSAVVSTYSEEIDGDDLDAAIDQARGKAGQEVGS